MIKAWCKAALRGIRRGFGSCGAPFRDVVAIMTAYNEGDVIACTIDKLVRQGIGVYLIDNWSTDDTLAKARRFLKRGLIGYEQFPAEGPSVYFEWARMLRRVEELHGQLGARWYIHHDADEIRDSPWPGVSYHEGILRVEREGFNCINHVVLEFKPTDDGFSAGLDMETYFRHFHMGKDPAHAIQFKVWRNFGQAIELASSGGHSVEFVGKGVYPVPFLVKHYPVRSQKHGLQKVLRERKQRYQPEERAKGWQNHYDHVTESYCFIGNPSELEAYDEVAFKTTLMAASRAARRLLAEKDQVLAEKDRALSSRAYKLARRMSQARARLAPEGTARYWVLKKMVQMWRAAASNGLAARTGKQ